MNGAASQQKGIRQIAGPQKVCRCRSMATPSHHMLAVCYLLSGQRDGREGHVRFADTSK